MNRGAVGNYLSDNQYNYLKDNVDLWHTNNCVIVLYRGTTGQMLLIRYDGTDYTAQRMDPDDLAPSDIAISNFMINIYNGTLFSNYIYIYGANGIVDYDSNITINIGVVSNYENVEQGECVKIKQLKTFNIFKAIGTIRQIWTADNNSLNALYKGNRSGNKTISPLVANYLDFDENNKPYLTSESQEEIARVCLGFYGDNWQKVWDTLQTTYNLLEDYHKVEEHSGTDTTTDKPNDWKVTDLREVNDNEENTEGNTYSYAFNSSNAVPVAKEDGKTTTKAKSEKTQTGEFGRETDYGHKIETSGKLGNKSYPELLQEELELETHNFYEKLFRDIDSVLTLSIYK